MVTNEGEVNVSSRSSALLRDVEASTRESVLALIVQVGPVSAAQLAQRLNLTVAAVRRHVVALTEQQLITAHGDEPGPCGTRGRGRPARMFVATHKGQEELSGAYAELALAALTYLSEIAGEASVAEFARHRISDIETRYHSLVKDGVDLPTRVQRLAEALSTEGYAATARPTGTERVIQLCQGHCPIRDVAAKMPQLCEAEAEAFSRLLGVHVQRLATLAAGEHVCTTSIPMNTDNTDGP